MIMKTYVYKLYGGEEEEEELDRRHSWVALEGEAGSTSEKGLGRGGYRGGAGEVAFRRICGTDSTCDMRHAEPGYHLPVDSRGCDTRHKGDGQGGSKGRSSEGGRRTSKTGKRDGGKGGSEGGSAARGVGRWAAVAGRGTEDGGEHTIDTTRSSTIYLSRSVSDENRNSGRDGPCLALAPPALGRGVGRRAPGRASMDSRHGRHASTHPSPPTIQL